MSDWGWVALGYGAVYGGLGAYVAWTAYRLRRARRRLAGLD